MPLVETAPDAVARTYARSLYELAESQGGRAKVEEVLSELEEILNMARADAKFGELLTSRSLNSEARGQALGRIFRGRITDLTCNFLLVLNDKGRVGSFSGVVAAFDSIVQHKFGRVEVDVFTADPLDADSLATLRARLQQSLGKEIVLHPYVEKSMIGGVKLRIGDQLIDGSLATQLRKMKDALDTDGSAALRARISDIIQGE